jgi:nucleotide-binding universal stress UspA family protein
MHRVLVGYDGSSDADRAIALVGSRPWPAGSSIRLLTVAPGALELRYVWHHLAPEDAERLRAQVVAEADAVVAPARERLAASGLRVERLIATDRPARALAEEAGRFEADLLVVGSRGQGTIQTAILGTVSSEVVDIAPCPVLVARHESLRRILLATDGSPAAEVAERYLATSPIAAGIPITVVSVAEILGPWIRPIVPSMLGQVMDSYAEHEAAARRSHRQITTATLERLTSAGMDVEAATVEAGDPAAGILRAADDVAADLIVLGSRGWTGLRRLVLGSVARRVLQGAQASVLVVRAGMGEVTTTEPGHET